tara:strand:+ start:4876 stop:5193 length:318 start_codon:yes stop_codon:yes gene_type:complete
MNKTALERLQTVVDGTTKSPKGNDLPSSKGKPKVEFVGFHLEPKLKKQLGAIAEAEGVTVSQFLRDVVHYEIRRCSRSEPSSRELYLKELRARLVQSFAEDEVDG